VTRVGWVIEIESPELRASVVQLRARLDGAGFVPADLADADAVVVWADHTLDRDLALRLADRRTRVVLAGPTVHVGDPERVLGEAAGLYVGGTTPIHDVRVRAGRDGGIVPMSGHAHSEGDHVGVHDHVTDRVMLSEKVSDDVLVLRTAFVGLDEHPVMTWRPDTSTAVWAFGTHAGAVDDMAMTRALASLLRVVLDAPTPPPVRVGLLGYGAIGHEHSRAVRSVEGLELTAVCDTSLARLDAAVEVAPGIAATVDADDLLARDDVDLVVVSTPPSTHASWALRAIRAGKHVVVEKPFAISTSEADEVMAEAAAADRLAVVYQNRRFDPDHLAVRRAVRGGALGEVFHIETFVGGYGHPCNLWHSDEGVSGGAFYDWGSHVLDQILDLVPTDIDHVTAAAHKRRWFDVTNADHSRVTIRFTDGAEAEFIHSDLAAALKPRWYVLGTQGAIVGSWRAEKIVSRNDIGTLSEDVLAPADSPPMLDLHAADGSVTRLATPAAQAYSFHRELADRLRVGLPMTVTAEQSRRVLAVMEAARISAEENGRPVVPR
jgi:scyllo-inositol 2-dehydrogenase (NADP+)